MSFLRYLSKFHYFLFIAIEPLANYKGNPKCVNGHLPWPGGCCSKCMPPNALVKQQTYRHCDYLSFQDDRVGNKFVSEWLKNPFIQRASLLFGYVYFCNVYIYNLVFA